MLSVKGLGKEYRSGASNQVVFNHLDLEIETGEVVTGSLLLLASRTEALGKQLKQIIFKRLF